MQAISDTLSDAFGQRQISTIFGQANQYRVILEAMPEYQRDPSTLSKLYLPAGAVTTQPTLSSATSNLPILPTASTNLVPLSIVATLERTTAPLAIMHEEQFPAATLSFNLAPGASLGDAVAAISAAEAEIGMPATVSGSYAGDAAEFESSLAGEPWLILAAAVTIYIVLGMLYESFVHPLTILSTLPSAGVGALLALMWFGQDLSIVALIGVVLLMGIVKKNAIMMIDFALDAERTRRHDAARGDHRSLPAAIPPDHDDDARRAARGAAARHRGRHRLRAALPARHHHHRRPAAEPGAHALHDAGDLSRHGSRPRQARRRAGAAGTGRGADLSAGRSGVGR